MRSNLHMGKKLIHLPNVKQQTSLCVQVVLSSMSRPDSKSFIQIYVRTRVTVIMTHRENLLDSSSVASQAMIDVILVFTKGGTKSSRSDACLSAQVSLAQSLKPATQMRFAIIFAETSPFCVFLPSLILTFPNVAILPPLFYKKKIYPLFVYLCVGAHM